MECKEGARECGESQEIGYLMLYLNGKQLAAAALKTPFDAAPSVGRCCCIGA